MHLAHIIRVNFSVWEASGEHEDAAVSSVAHILQICMFDSVCRILPRYPWLQRDPRQRDAVRNDAVRKVQS
jgi:hypothetical protein